MKWGKALRAILAKLCFLFFTLAVLSSFPYISVSLLTNILHATSSCQRCKLHSLLLAESWIYIIFLIFFFTRVVVLSAKMELIFLNPVLHHGLRNSFRKATIWGNSFQNIIGCFSFRLVIQLGRGNQINQFWVDLLWSHVAAQLLKQNIVIVKMLGFYLQVKFLFLVMPIYSNVWWCFFTLG